MIIKGNIRTDGGHLADYLLGAGRYVEKNANERAEIWEAPGADSGDTLQNILRDFEKSAAGTACTKPLFHVQMRLVPEEALTREQWLEGINRLEKRVDLTDCERVIVAHERNGQQHLHVVWNRINPERHKAAELRYYKHKCTDLARELERAFGLRELSNDRKRGKVSIKEERQTLRHGKSPQAIKETLRECWQRSETGYAFITALKEHGLTLAKGDRRDFVVVDNEGGVYSLTRITGSKTAEVLSKLSGIEHKRLPTVAQVRRQHKNASAIQIAIKERNEGLIREAGKARRGIGRRFTGSAVRSAPIRATWPRITWRAAHNAVTRRSRRIMARRRPHMPPPINAEPIRPMNHLTAEMWKDYRIFKAAGLLHEWCRKWAAYLPELG